VDLPGAGAGPVQVVEKYRMRYRMCRLGKVDFEPMQPLGALFGFIEHPAGCATGSGA